MNIPNDTPDGLKVFEARLAALEPAEVARRDAVMFAAGRRAGLAGRRRWRAATALASGLAVAALTIALAGQPGPPAGGVGGSAPDALARDASPRDAGPVDRRRGFGQPERATPQTASDGASFVGLRTLLAPPTMQNLPPNAYGRLRREVLARGLSALPAPVGRPAEVRSARQLFEELTDPRLSG